MKITAKLISLTLLMVVILGLYFEYVVSRPMNAYIQYAASVVVLIGTIAFLVYLVKQLLKILNP